MFLNMLRYIDIGEIEPSLFKVSFHNKVKEHSFISFFHLTVTVSSPLKNIPIPPHARHFQASVHINSSVNRISYHLRMLQWLLCFGIHFQTDLNLLKEYIVRMIFSSNLYTIFLDKKALCCFILY
jgi:hypothetical protein